MSRDTPQGLTSAEAARLLAQHGPNRLAAQGRRGPLPVLLRQFTGLLVLLLIGAAGIAFALGDVINGLAIAVVVVLNGLLGFVQEWRAENLLDSLRRMVAPTARVIRDGAERQLPSDALVPGDLVLLERGNRVPADMALDASDGLEVDESALTGESVPVHKGPEDRALSMGTSVVAGSGQGLVTATGGATRFGAIAGMAQEAGGRSSTLQRQIARLARQITLVAVILAVAVTLAGIAGGGGAFEMLMVGLSLAVSLVPEGLPAVLTVTLALGASALARQGALVRRMQALETLGAATVICTDKTGTLTENKMTVTQLWTAGGLYEVTGTGYDPAGHIRKGGEKRRAADDALLADVLETARLCNTATLEQGAGDWQMTGSPTEGALLVLARKGWAATDTPEGLRIGQAFSSSRKRMSVLAPGGGAMVLHVKGAPERILELSTRLRGPGGITEMTPEARQAAEEAVAEMSGQGLRVIGLAMHPEGNEHREEELVFLGLAGIIDPPRPEVPPAVAGCRAAGIRVIMITGDAPGTAAAIAGQVGLAEGQILTGDQLDAMDDGALAAALQAPVHFARTRPEHKLRIVGLLQAEGAVVAMTGDGVNDAPALREADIGVSMGQRGTDVAREASDVVLLDDNFATIVRAAGEGRRQFANIRKFVTYLLSSNAGEVLAVGLSLILGLPLIFMAAQILWINLVTDGASALALGLERSETGQMRRPPRRPGAPIVDRTGMALIAVFGLYAGLASLWVFMRLLPGGEELARSAAFTALVAIELLAVFAFRSLRIPCTRLGWFSNPLLILAVAVSAALQWAAVSWGPLQLILQTRALGAAEWVLVAAVALPALIVPELAKLAWTALRGRPAVQGAPGPG